MSLHQIAVINGPNLNLLGTREPEIYGATTLADIESILTALAGDLGAEISFMQDNREGELVDAVQQAAQKADGILLNAAAFTHTSIALRDAVSAVAIPTIEVHLSNVFAREDFRHHSYLSDICVGVISGFGAESYKLALRAMVTMLANKLTGAA